MTAIDYHSAHAAAFHASYQSDPNRKERVRVWNQLLDRYATGARVAYDIGCGTGVFTCVLARRGLRVFGMDGSAEMLGFARQNAQESGLMTIRFEQRQMPFAVGPDVARADLVISSSCIEYMESLPEALAFLRALVRDDGVVLLSLSNRQSIVRWCVRCVYRLTGAPRYLKFLRHFSTLDQIQPLLQAAGLRMVEHRFLEGDDRLNRLLRLVLPPQYVNNMILVVARPDVASISLSQSVHNNV